MDYLKLPTPPVCVADFCLIPIGTLTASVSNEVAAVQRLMKASGLSYSMHSAGTTVEGPWDAVTRLIGQAHTLVHQNGVARVQTDIRIGTRTDKKQHFSEKVAKVEAILAADGKAASVGTGTGEKAESVVVLGGRSVDAEGNEGHVAGDGEVGVRGKGVEAGESKVVGAGGGAAQGQAQAQAQAQGQGQGQGQGPQGQHKGTWASMFRK